MDWLKGPFPPTIAGVVFLGAAVHEWWYKADHPHAYGPAVVIAVACLAGALLSFHASVGPWEDWRRTADWERDQREKARLLRENDE
jgi:hypothetical protein